MNDLTNKVALITGSAKGIGKAIAQRYAALGAARHHTTWLEAGPQGGTSRPALTIN